MRISLGIGVSALFLVLLLARVDRDELVDALASAKPGWLVLAVLVYFVGLWLRAVRWRLILIPSTNLTNNDAFALVVIGAAANNILPMRAGELVRAELLRERHGANRLTALGTIVLERALDGIVLVIFLSTTLAIAGGTSALRTLAAVMLVLFLGLMLLFLVAAARPGGTVRWSLRLLARLPRTLRLRARRWMLRLLTGLTAIRTPGMWGVVSVVTVVSWLFEGTMYWLVGVGFGLDLHPALYLGVAGAANLAIGVPSSSGGIGPFELFAREIVVSFGATTAVGTAYALVLHALLLVPVVLFGIVLVWRRHIAVDRVLHATIDGEPAPAGEPIAAADAFRDRRTR